MSLCPCGSGKALELCCQPYILSQAKAPSAEALMRSRYSAYVLHAIDYILATTTTHGGKDVDPASTKAWAEESTWLGLTVVRTEKGGAIDNEGEVEFIARYKQDGKENKHHEAAFFKKEAGVWLYDHGSLVTETVVRLSPKQGRNDPCQCGSLKKFKHCHGK